MKKVIAYTALHYGKEYLADAIRSVIDYVDQYWVIYTPVGSPGHRTDAPCPESKEELSWIANDAADKILCFDLNFLPLIEKLAPQLTTVKHFVAMVGRSHMPAQSTIAGLLCYEDLIDAEDGVYRWPEFDENTASGICLWVTKASENATRALDPSGSFAWRSKSNGA